MSEKQVIDSLSETLDPVKAYRTEATIMTYNASFDSVSIEKLVDAKIKQFNESKKRQWMMDGIRYYNNDSDIRNKQRFGTCSTSDNKMKRKQDYSLSNTKIHRSFMRKLTRQKQAYIFGKQFTLETEEPYQKLLESEYFTKFTYNLISTLTKQSIKQGINWSRISYDQFSQLQMERVPGEQVIPFWKDVEHTNLSELIHFYTIEVLEGETIVEKDYADYYDMTGIYHLMKDETGSYKIRSEQPYTPGHFYIDHNVTETVVDEVTGMVEHKQVFDEDNNPMIEQRWYVWEKLPWVAWKNNSEEHSLLKYIKSMQDGYEELLSTTIDIIKDIPEAIKVIKNYNGSYKNLEEVLDTISRYRIALVDEDGGIDSLDTPFNIEASDKSLTRLRRDLFEDGGGVDVQNVQVGEKSGAAIKFLYDDLDLDCTDIINQLKVSLEQLMFFIDFDIALKHGIDYSDVEVDFQFHKTGITNDTEVIEQINKSRGFIPDEMLYPYHPMVNDVSEIKDMMLKQEEEELQRMERTLETENKFSTGGPETEE